MNTDTQISPYAYEFMNFDVLTLMETILFDADFAALEKADADYDESVRDWYENGDGRSPEWVTSDDGRTVNIGGRGHRYPHCKHGTSLWTDYDNICGGCEDGSDNYTLAKDRAQSAYITWQDRKRAVDAMISALPSWQRFDLPEGTSEWVNKSITAILGEPRF